MKRTRLIALSFFMLAMGAATSNAKTAEESLNAAREAFDQGQGLFAQAKYDEAAAEFEKAYQARPFPQFLFNVAACYEKASKYGEAVGYYKKYLSENSEAKDKASVEKRIAALEKGIEELKAASAAGTEGPVAGKPQAVQELDEVEVVGLVIIESEPRGATIYLDSKKTKSLGKTPWNGSIEGEHNIMIEREGYKPVEKRLRPDAKHINILFFHMSEEDYLGWIEITSNIPGADIFIDDKSVGAYRKTPFSGNLTPGKHKIWITKPGYDEFYQEVNIVAGEAHKVEASLKGSEVGYLNIRGRGVENNAVYLDDKLLCARGPCRKPVSEGKHKISIRREGYKTYEQTVHMQQKTELTMRSRLAEKPSRSDAIWSYVIAAGFGGLGYWAGTQANSIEDELSDEIAAGNPPPDPGDSRFNKGKYWAIGADAAFGMSAVALTMAIYYTFRDKGPPSTGTTDVQTVSNGPQMDFELGPEFAGLGVKVGW